MTDSNHPYLDLIRQTRRCRPEVEETAAKLAHLSPEDYEGLIKELIRDGEDTTLGIVCNLCALNEVCLDPALAAEILKVIEPFTDFGALYRVQEKTAIAPLLKTALDEELSFERQVYAAMIAAEMSVVHKTDPQPVRRVLHILEQAYSINHPMLDSLLAAALDLLKAGKEDADPEEFLSQVNIRGLLPEERPPVIIGDGQTVRRPIPKIGRNAPCHCGSGKKYKKCCLDKEQELLRDASPYAGLTMSQVRAAPQLVDDARIIDQMRAYELKKLDPATLNPDQLYAAYRRAELFGLRDLAFDMLLELEQRPGEHDFDKGHFIDLMEWAIDAGNMELAERVRRHVPDELLAEPELTRLRFDLLQDTQHLEPLESLLRREMTLGEDAPSESPLIGLSYAFEKTLPALCIVFARAYLCEHPDRMLDSETLLGAVRRARAEIGIEAWDDPIEDYMEWSFTKDLEEFREADRSDRLGKLIDDAETAREKARAKEKELRQKERELDKLSSKLEKQIAQAAQPAAGNTPQPAPPTAPQKETISRLRERIGKLKGEVSAQQQIRRDLREELRSEREKSLKQPEISQASPEQTQASVSPATPKPLKTVLIPEYASAFHRACKTVPPPVAAKAIKAAGEFAAADEAVWRHARPIKRMAECYRIRIGRNYRLLIRWTPEKSIRVLDLIPRKSLETWIRKNC